ncbi:hypothetical protein BD31_I1693 [Candidatus Nitrosopumilus salaria BD31]|uniref:TRASH domain-containing protein n=1 Tax=Candidatus Nitrosopumilus salarius BD31 TaxID=859350 RepID=I3D372_9ARCH|nr:hypothetical protein [Candidatus Nitrosopumilus salaria]EIJ66165.1 hypothetical protein BD31_I1693 [Candidatus Nitrosopumilus salaria BD31]
MFGFKKYCPICGVEVDKKTTHKRFGKYFCNEEHANRFVIIKTEEENQQEEYRKNHPRRGGCC